MKSLNVLYSSSDSYAYIAAVSIYSLLKNNESFDSIHIYFITNGVTQRNLQLLEEMVSSFDFASLDIVDSGKLDEKLEALGVTKFGNSYATFQKIFVNEIIPKDVDTLLYIDSDTIVMSDLSEIYDISRNMKNPISVVKVPFFARYHEMIGVSKNSIYPNCGVILFDLKKWKAECCEERIIAYLKDDDKIYRAADQDILSIVLEGEMGVLPPKYNVGPGWKFYGPKDFCEIHDCDDKNFYSLDELENAIKNPAILHCLGGFYGRPWEEESCSPFLKEWDYYANYTPWKEGKKRVRRRPMQKVQKICFVLLPRKLYISLFKTMIRIEARYKYKKNNL